MTAKSYSIIRCKLFVSFGMVLCKLQFCYLCFELCSSKSRSSELDHYGLAQALDKLVMHKENLCNSHWWKLGGNIFEHR